MQIRSITSCWTMTRANWRRRSRWIGRRWKTPPACSRWSWRPANWSMVCPATINWRYRRPRRPWRLRTSTTCRPRLIGASTTSKFRKMCRTVRHCRIWTWRWKIRMLWVHVDLSDYRVSCVSPDALSTIPIERNGTLLHVRQRGRWFDANALVIALSKNQEKNSRYTVNAC